MSPCGFPQTYDTLPGGCILSGTVRDAAGQLLSLSPQGEPGNVLLDSFRRVPIAEGYTAKKWASQVTAAANTLGQDLPPPDKQQMAETAHYLLQASGFVSADSRIVGAIPYSPEAALLKVDILGVLNFYNSPELRLYILSGAIKDAARQLLTYRQKGGPGNILLDSFRGVPIKAAYWGDQLACHIQAAANVLGGYRSYNERRDIAQTAHSLLQASGLPPADMRISELPSPGKIIDLTKEDYHVSY